MVSTDLYIEIVLFSDQNGKPMSDIINVGGIADKKYYHGGIDSMIRTMNTALEVFARRSVAHDQEELQVNAVESSSSELSTSTDTTTPIMTVAVTTESHLARGNR